MRILLLVTLLFPFTMMAQTDDCMSHMKDGKFKYHGISASDCTIERHKNKQVEIYNSGTAKLITSVEWTSDTTYILHFKKSVKAPGCLKAGESINVQVTGCKGNSYTAVAESNGCGAKEVTFEKISN